MDAPPTVSVLYGHSAHPPLSARRNVASFNKGTQCHHERHRVDHRDQTIARITEKQYRDRIVNNFFRTRYWKFPCDNRNIGSLRLLMTPLFLRNSYFHVRQIVVHEVEAVYMLTEWETTHA